MEDHLSILVYLSEKNFNQNDTIMGLILPRGRNRSLDESVFFAWDDESASLFEGTFLFRQLPSIFSLLFNVFSI